MTGPAQNAMIPLLRLRVREIVRTWRVWVLPTVLVLLAVSGPLITRFTKEILAGALGSEEFGDGGLEAIPFPDPSAADAAGRWISDLSQLAVFVVVVMAAGAISSEVRSGVATLLLVKPASRTAYVLSHAIVLVLFVAASALIGAFLSWGVTAIVFEGEGGAAGFSAASLRSILGATLVWLVLATLLIAVSLLASAAFDAMAAAAGIGIGTFFLLVLAGMAPRLTEYTPAGLNSVATDIAAGVHDGGSGIWWPVVTGLLLAAALLVAAVLVFRRRELR